MARENNCSGNPLGSVNLQKALYDICRIILNKHAIRRPNTLVCNRLLNLKCSHIKKAEDIKGHLDFVAEEITAMTLVPFSIFTHSCSDYMLKTHSRRGVRGRSLHNFDIHVLKHLLISASSILSIKHGSYELFFTTVCAMHLLLDLMNA